MNLAVTATEWWIQENQPFPGLAQAVVFDGVDLLRRHPMTWTWRGRVQVEGQAKLREIAGRGVPVRRHTDGGLVFSHRLLTSPRRAASAPARSLVLVIATVTSLARLRLKISVRRRPASAPCAHTSGACASLRLLVP